MTNTLTSPLTIPHRDERLTTARQSAMESVKASPHLAAAFKELTPAQQAGGKLIGKLLETGKGNAAVDAAFAWWEIEHNNGEPLDLVKKNIALVEAIAATTLGGGEENYRNLRKVFVALNQQ